jgi:cytochrome c peroxidase
MHSGSLYTIEDVVEHYNDVKNSLKNYKIPPEISAPYQEDITYDTDPARNKLRFNLISVGEVRRGLKFTKKQKADLTQFLKTGLLDYRFQRDRKH